MNTTAFFPGKFHPPHLGHLKTLLDIINDYDKLIIGVSEHQPENPMITVDNIIYILQYLFEKHQANVEVVRIEGVLVEKESLEGLPKFDVLLSGNPDVLVWADKMGIRRRFIGRAEGLFFSGTEIRDELHDS